MFSSSSSTAYGNEIRSYLMKTNHYDILGVNKNAENEEIKKAYKKLALRFHPDKNDAPGSKEVFNKITTAYQNLTSQRANPTNKNSQSQNWKGQNQFQKEKKPS